MASVIIMRYLNLEFEYECRAQRRHVTSAGTTLRHIRTAWGRACPEKLVPTEDEVVLLCTSEGIWWSEVNVSTCLYPDQSLERCAGSRTGQDTYRALPRYPCAWYVSPRPSCVPYWFVSMTFQWSIRSPSVPSVWGCNPKIPRCSAAARLELTSQLIYWWMHKLPPLSPGLK